MKNVPRFPDVAGAWGIVTEKRLHRAACSCGGCLSQVLMPI